ncbi:MAG TPA: MBL fold metallo-hydrolase [Solirubrobacteraceae bacterium]|nr:MBL fold metallo-hydrolase [Solirubrobacteraceae bacterium]
MSTSQQAFTVPKSGAGRLPRAASDARAHAVCDGVWSLQLPLCYESVASTNAYLLAGRDGWILVDCGSCLAPGWEALEVALGQAGAAPDQLELLVVTHSHADHRGLAAEIIRQTGCEMAMGEGPHPLLDVLRDASLPLEGRRARGLREGIPRAGLDRFVNDLPGGDGVYPVAEPSRVLLTGERLESQTGPWEVVPVPGHSADQIALWNARIRHVISADLALPGPASYLEHGTRPDPHGDQLASLDRVIALGPDVVLAGHGRPVGDGIAFLHACREKALDRARATQAALGSTPVSGFQVAASMTPADADAGHWQRSMAEALSVLEHFESHGLARSTNDPDGIRRWTARAR